MARTFWKNATIDLSELKIEQMLEVMDIIRIAQRAEPGELATIKAGLDKAFGADWKDFKPTLSSKPY